MKIEGSNLASRRLSASEQAARDAAEEAKIDRVDIRQRLDQVPDKYRSIFRRVYLGEAGRAQRVKAKCLDCCNYNRAEVRECGARFCPLHAIRPYQTNDNDDETNETDNQ